MTMALFFLRACRAAGLLPACPPARCLLQDSSTNIYFVFKIKIVKIVFLLLYHNKDKRARL
jgi:hypothetical protein